MDFAAVAKAALEKRANLVSELRGINDDASLSEAEKRERIERVDADVLSLEAEARDAVERGEREAEARSLAQRAGGLILPGQERQEQRGQDEGSELRALARGEATHLDFDLRTATAGSPGNAGNTHGTTFVAQVIEAMRWRSQFFSLARTLTTSGGEVLEYPVKNTRPTASMQAENTPYSKSDESWSKTNIGAYKYGVIVEATNEIIDDSALDIQGILAEDAGIAVADKVMADLLTGDGSAKPYGWATRSTAGVGVTGAIAAVTADNMIDLQHSLLMPYRKGSVFMTSDTMVQQLRKLKDGQGRYLWEPSVQAGAPDTFQGYQVLTDPNMPTAGAGAKVVLFGDPSKYLIRQVKNLRVVRSEEYGFDRDVVAFKVTWRGSGDLFDTASVKALTVTA